MLSSFSLSLDYQLIDITELKVEFAMLGNRFKKKNAPNQIDTEHFLLF